MNQVCQALSGGEKVYSFPTFHPKEQNTQPFFSELIELLPSAPHSFRNQDADKTGNSSDPTLQILYGQPRKHGNVNTEKNQNPALGRSLEEEKHLQAMHWKNPPLRKKVKQQHVKDAGKRRSLDTGWTGVL